MAEETGQEKTEEPTSKRLSDSRKKGQIPRSRELNTLAMLLAGSVCMLMMGERISAGLWGLMRNHFRIEREAIFDPSVLTSEFRAVVFEGFVLIMPLLGVMVFVAIAAPVMFGGWAFSFESMQPKFEKLDPIRGIPRLFALRGLVELIKSLFKFLLIFGVAIGFTTTYFGEFVGLGRESLLPALAHGGHLLTMAFLVLSSSLLVIAAFDVPFQLWDHKRKLKMTRQEIKDENKETDGRPEVKSRIRGLQMEMAQRRMMEEVPKADVIVTNPTHFAVALKYDQQTGGAPRLVAKGTDLVAAQIRNLATGADVPLVAAPPLARALFYSTDLDQEIPEGLYLAVAQILAYVYQLKAAGEQGGDAPRLPDDLPVPDEFKRPEI